MFQNFKTYLNYGRRFTSIWMHNDNQTPLFYVADGKLTNNEIEIINTFHTQSLDELAKRLGKRKHAYLTLSGSGILSKMSKSNSPDDKVLSETFPNIDLKQFYYSIHHEADKVFVSVCRKSMMDSILLEFEEKGIYLTGISIDLLGLKNLIHELPEKNLYPGNYEVLFDDDHIKEINKSSFVKEPRKFEIGNNFIEEPFLVPIGSISNYFSSNENSNLINLENKRSKLSKEKAFFTIILGTGISAILIALLINFLFFSNYYKEIEQLRKNYQTELVRKSQIDKYKKDLARTKSIASSFIDSDESKASFYLNRITSGAPGSILFEKIHFQPLLRKLKQGKELEIENKVLVIQGISMNKSEFSSWLNQLKNLAWVSKLNIADFKNTTENNSFFRLQFKIKDE